MKALLFKALILFAFVATTSCANAPDHSARPQERPAEKARLFGLLKSKETKRLEAGMVCGDPALQGEFVGNVPGKINGCGVKDAVRLRAVSGVTLSQQAVMDCATAKALKTWVDEGLQPAFKRQGGVVRLRVAAHYVCRTRNHKAGAKISEHGKGRAIDISGVWLENGREISVLKDYRSGRAGKALRRAQKAACGPFGTVLGPGSDGYHEDHFHFDTARYRSGPYCR